MLSWGGGKSSKFIRNGIRSLRAGVIIVEWLKWEVCESMGGKVKEKGNSTLCFLKMWKKSPET